MNNTTTQPASLSPLHYPEEYIMVIKRCELFVQEEGWQGMLSTNIEPYLERIHTLHTFFPRSRMETDPTYKQIIPYMVFTYNNRYFLMQRAQANEQRLRDKFTLGIGGHVRLEDLTDKSLWSWAQREFEEEIEYKGNLKISTMGIVNDDSNSVGQVHVGLVLLLEGDSPNISIKSEMKSGVLATLEECKIRYDALESWSQIVLNALSQ